MQITQHIEFSFSSLDLYLNMYILCKLSPYSNSAFQWPILFLMKLYNYICIIYMDMYNIYSELLLIKEAISLQFSIKSSDLEKLLNLIACYFYYYY